MKRPNDIDETASRANDWKTPEEREAGKRLGPAPTPRVAEVPAGGKQRNPRGG